MLTAFLIVVLVGIGALALDVGRLFVLHTQMENAVDAAALAAARELDGKTGAINRAKEAARSILEHNSTYTGDTLGEQLLGASQLPDPAFTFYSEIDPDRIIAVGDDDAGYVRVVLGHEQASRHINLFFLPVLKLMGLSSAYIDQAEAKAQVAALAGISRAYCKFNPLMMCNPFEIEGDPSTYDLWKDIPVGGLIKVKEQSGGGTIAPGGFAWLDPLGPNSNEEFVKQIARNSNDACETDVVDPNTGQEIRAKAAINVRFGIDPGSDDPQGYLDGFLDGTEDWPAPNIIDYPRDKCMEVDTSDCLTVKDKWGNDYQSDRFGNGDWSGYENTTPLTTTVMPSQLTRYAYYKAYHLDNGSLLTLNPSDYDPDTGLTRADIYRSELGLMGNDDWETEKPEAATWYIPVLPASSTIDVVENFPGDIWKCALPEDDLNDNKCMDREQNWFDPPNPAKKVDGNITDGTTPGVSPPLGSDDLAVVGQARRRVLTIMVVNCQTAKVGGTSPIPLSGALEAGVAKLFLTEHSRNPSGVDVFAEWMGEISEDEYTEYRKYFVQLYDTN